MTKTILDITVAVIAFASITVAFVFLLSAGIKKQERMECMKWVGEKHIYGELYTIPDWQREQCADYGISL